jgi:hypothetical protein
MNVVLGSSSELKLRPAKEQSARLRRASTTKEREEKNQSKDWPLQNEQRRPPRTIAACTGKFNRKRRRKAADP